MVLFHTEDAQDSEVKAEEVLPELARIEEDAQASGVPRVEAASVDRRSLPLYGHLE